MIALMRKYMDRLRLLLVASLVTVSLGCATWEDYRDSSGAGKADAEVAIFKAHLANTRRIVSASDGRIEYQYNPAQKLTPLPAAHQRIRLLPGQYTITAKTWPFGSLYEFEVNLEAGHKYKVETFLCNFECRSKGKPYRHDRWIQDLTTHERISSVESECYLAKPRGGERRRVPCPDEEDDSDSRGAGKSSTEVAKVEEEMLQEPIAVKQRNRAFQVVATTANRITDAALVAVVKASMLWPLSPRAALANARMK